MTQWNIKETRDLVRTKYGNEQLELVRPCLQSVFDRQWYAGYHYKEALYLQDSFVSSRLTSTCLFDVVFGQDANATDDFNRFLLEAGAHVLACVQSIHATADILAHVAYFALGVNLSSKPIDERNISLASVVGRLRQEAPVATIYALLNELASAGNFTHLSALANHSKHRSIIRPLLTEDWTGEALERHSLKIPSFFYSRKPYPEIAVKDFLEPEYHRCSQLVVDTGNALNVFLSTSS